MSIEKYSNLYKLFGIIECWLPAQDSVSALSAPQNAMVLKSID